MVNKLEWVPEGSRLGLLVEYGEKMATNERELVDMINEKVGCQIKAPDFLALGRTYFRTEAGKRNAEIINNYFKDLEERKIR
jgi:hypothetical protein